MRLALTLLAVCFLALGLCGCCSGQPTATLGLPTLQFGQNASQPQQTVQVPMVPAYTVQSAPAYPAPAVPRYTAPCP